MTRPRKGKRSAEARALSLPQYRPKRTKDRKKYSRKRKHRKAEMADVHTSDHPPVMRVLTRPTSQTKNRSGNWCNMQTTTFHPWRPVAFFVGLALTGLGAYGVFEYAVQLEGGRVTYLVLAATVIAVMAGFLPPMAENQWKQGAVAKSLMLWAVFVPVLLCVFYANAERMHAGKAGQSAQITAKSAAVERAESELNEARQAVTRAIPAEARANATPQAQCGTNCRAALETAKAARERVTKAEQALVAAQSQAITESPLKAPVWLLPVTLDVLAFLGIWIGLAGPWWTQAPQAAERAPVRTRKAPSKAKPRGKRMRLVPANANNVVPMNPAG